MANTVAGNTMAGGTAGAATATICQDQGMARRKLRPTPWALTIVAWDIWRRLPPEQQRMLVRAARKHGPRLAARAVKVAKPRRRK